MLTSPLLKDCDEKVLVAGVYQALRDLVFAQREAAGPSMAKVCYHVVQDKPQPGDPLHFDLELKHTLYFRAADLPAQVKDEDGKEGSPGQKKKVVSQTHIAGAIPHKAWRTRATGITWIMKWVPNKGLQPLRPQVVFCGQVVLPPRTVVELEG